MVLWFSGILAGWSIFLPKKHALAEKHVRFQENVVPLRIGVSRASAALSGSCLPPAECDAGGGARGREHVGVSRSQELGEYCMLSPLTCPMITHRSGKGLRFCLARVLRDSWGVRRRGCGGRTVIFLNVKWTVLQEPRGLLFFCPEEPGYVKQSWSSLRTLDAGLRWFECHVRGRMCGHSQTGSWRQGAGNLRAL